MEELLKGETEATIQRIVCFKFKSGTATELIDQQMQEFAALKDTVHQILSFNLGTTIQGELKEKPEFEVMYYITFLKEEDISGYYYHPAHLKFVEKHAGTWEKFFAVNSLINY